MQAFRDTDQCAPDGNHVTSYWSGASFTCPTNPNDDYLGIDAQFVDAAARAAHRYKQLDEYFIDGAVETAVTCEYVMGVDARIVPSNAADAASKWNGFGNKKVLPPYSDGRQFNRSARNKEPYCLRYSKPANSNRVVRLKSPFEEPGLCTWFRIVDGDKTLYLRTRGNRNFVYT